MPSSSRFLLHVISNHKLSKNKCFHLVFNSTIRPSSLQQHHSYSKASHDTQSQRYFQLHLKNAQSHKKLNQRVSIPFSPSKFVTKFFSITNPQDLCLSKRRFSNQNRIDPTAKRPTSVCDPYGQGGKPLAYAEAINLLQTLEKGWEIEISQEECDSEQTKEEENAKSIFKEFYHADFMKGSQFLSHIAAVGHISNHYPHLTLERRLLKKKKAWCVVTRVTCMTPPLNGLSYNDIHLAMLIDVEVAREKVHELILKDTQKNKKTI